MWFTVSGVIIAIAIASILIRGFTFGIDFEGGTTVSFPSGNVTAEQVEEVYRNTLGQDPEQVVLVGSGGSATVQIRSETLSNDETAKLRDALFERVPAQGRRRPTEQAGDQRFGGVVDMG